MGRKPKIIPSIPGTIDEIVEAIFAKDKDHIKKKKDSREVERPPQLIKREKDKPDK